MNNPQSVQSIYFENETLPYGLMSSDGSPLEWSNWGKEFASVEARSAWLEANGFEVVDEIEEIPVEWARRKVDA